MAVSYGTNKAVTKGFYQFQDFSWLKSLGLSAAIGLWFAYRDRTLPAQGLIRRLARFSAVLCHNKQDK
ncbi:hypothetical protein AEAC466_15640 [Asticcacaulis sp. AC466]|nr:hypothetical protein AEAC466_15640 [Asticcacaulis sp. AC466]